MDKKFWIKIGLRALVVLGVGLVAYSFVARGANVAQDFGLAIDQLEHGSGSVAMSMPIKVVPIYVNGDRVGRLDSIVFLREGAGSPDGIRIVVHPRNEAVIAEFEDCSMKLRSLDHFELKKAIRCVWDTDGLVSFGEVVFTGMDYEAPLFVEAEDLDHIGWDVPHQTDWDEVELEQLGLQMEQLVRQLQVRAGELGVEVEELSREIQEEVLRELRAELQQVREVRESRARRRNN